MRKLEINPDFTKRHFENENFSWKPQTDLRVITEEDFKPGLTYKASFRSTFSRCSV